MTLNIFRNGTLADANQVDQNQNFNTTLQVINSIRNDRVYNTLFSGSKTLQPNIISDYVLFKNSTNIFNGNVSGSTLGHVGSSNCLISGLGIIAFGSLIDNYSDGTINTSLWSLGSSSTSVTFTESPNGSGLVIDVPDIQAATIGSVNLTGFNFNGSNTEILVHYSMKIAGVSSGQGGTAEFGINNGAGTKVVLDTAVSNNANEGAKSNKFLYMRYIHSIGSLYVDKLYSGSQDDAGDGSAHYYSLTTYGSYNLNTLTNKNLYFLGSTANNGAGDFGNFTICIHGILFNRTGTIGSSSFITNPIVVNESGSTGLIYNTWLPLTDNGSPLMQPTGSVFATANFNNTGTFGSVNMYGSWATPGTSGSTIKTKITVTNPSTIVTGSYHTPILTGWGIAYN